MEYESRISHGESYPLGRRLKSGSSGDVFETTHPLLPGPCAIKIIRPELAGNPETVAEFRADLEAVAALGHPNIVRVIEVGSGPQPFVVMELLEGRLLAEQLAGQRMVPLVEAAQIIKAVAAALQAAHSRGIVHGEINPGNIFLARTEGYDQGVVKLLNFGISRLRPIDGGFALNTEATRYLSPEQAAGRGDVIDGRADQFSLAALAHRLVTGVDVYRGDSPISLLYEIVHQQPELASLGGGGPEVEAVIERGLSRGRTDRFETVVAFARAFERAVTGEATGGPIALMTPSPRPPTPEPRVTPPTQAPAPVVPGFQMGNTTLHGFASSRGDDVRSIGGMRLVVDSRPAPASVPVAAPAPVAPPPAVVTSAIPVVPANPVTPRMAVTPPPEVPIVRSGGQHPARARPEATLRPQPAPRRLGARASTAPVRPRPAVRSALAVDGDPPESVDPERADSLLTEPFFDAYPDGHAPRRRRVVIDDDLDARPPRNGWKLLLFSIAVFAASVGAALGVGWRPPLEWRQMPLWHQLGLPGAAGPTLPTD